METKYKIKHNDVCRRCLGEGIIITPGYDHGHGHKENAKEEVCTLCGGTGLVQVEKNIEVQITPKTPKFYVPRG